MNQLRKQEDLLAEQELREQEQAAQEKEEPPQNFNIRQLIREVCGIKFCEKQKQNMEDTMLELLKVCRQKELYFNAIVHVLPTEEPEYSLSMGYDHLSTILEMESDEVIRSSVKNLVQIPSEYEVTSDDESECDLPVKDESSPIFTTISNPTFDYNDDFTSSDDESLSNEDTLPTSPIPVEDSDSLREEIDIFTDTDDFMPPGIESDDYDSEGDIHFLEELLGNDSFPLPEDKLSNFDHHDDPSFPRPPLEPPDVEVFFDFEPNSGELISAVMSLIKMNVLTQGEDCHAIFEDSRVRCFVPVHSSFTSFACH
nr:hypothetical protein [Tanacetum cinerariifolium]